MTRREAKRAMADRTKVQAGKPGTQDHDTGRIVALKGNMAEVAWDSGVRTPCSIGDLETADARQS